MYIFLSFSFVFVILLPIRKIFIETNAIGVFKRFLDVIQVLLHERFPKDMVLPSFFGASNLFPLWAGHLK